MDLKERHSSLLRDIIFRLERIQEDLSRIRGSQIPDRFLPLNEACIAIKCGRDWLVSQIKEGVLRPGIDYMDRSVPGSQRRRYLVNPLSTIRWINTSSLVGKIHEG